MSEPTNKKKVVKVETAASKSTTDASGKKEPVWKPTPEAKAQSTKLRVVSWVLWILAIATEVALIIWVVPQASERLWLLLVLLIPIAVLAIIANLLWKKANRLDPASKKNAFAFFVQNQLGAIMTVIAFLPLIIFVLLDKNMDGKQKGIVGAIAAVAMIAIAAFTGTEWDGGPSQEQYAEEENIMMLLTGEDNVFWVKSGKVFHVCADVPDVNKESKDGQIYEGTVAEAHAAGKDRLTLRWESEATKYCGYTQEEVDTVKAGLSAVTPDESDNEAPAEDAGGTDADAEDAGTDETGAGTGTDEADTSDE